jgi:hypothetical protein
VKRFSPDQSNEEIEMPKPKKVILKVAIPYPDLDTLNGFWARLNYYDRCAIYAEHVRQLALKEVA